MKSIAYLLHRFPGVTDTFIKREIESIEKTGTAIHVVSVWKPKPNETTPESMLEWADVKYLLPRSAFSIAFCLLRAALLSPLQFMSTARLAMQTSRPGIRGILFQAIYFVQSILAGDAMRRLRVEHIHNHFGDHGGLITMFASKFTNIPYSISFHGPHVFYDGFNGAMKQKVASAQFVRCIGYFCRSQVIVFSACTNLASIKIVHCGLDLKEYDYRAPRPQAKQIFSAARLAPEKGFIFLLEAFAQLVAKGLDLRLRLAGGGPEQSRLEQAAVRLAIADRVTFLGNLAEKEIYNELCSSDLFVLPSLAEGIPVSLMEAMAVGVPVIATNVAGVSELITDGVSGILVRPSDPESIACAMSRMIEDHSLRCEVSKFAREKVVNEFDSDRESAKLNRHFLEES